MPTYEYVCRDCARHLEVVQSFRDPALTTCGTCGGPLRKVFSAAGIIFRGSGYYITDARDRKLPKRTKEPSGAEGPAGSKPKDEPSSSGGAEASTAESA